MADVSIWPRCRNRTQATFIGGQHSCFLLPSGPFLEKDEKTFLKLRLAHSVKLVFSYVVKGRKIKITAKFRALRRLRFEETKRTMSHEMRPKSFGSFEKRAPGLQGIRCALDFGKRITKHLSVKHLFKT